MLILRKGGHRDLEKYYSLFNVDFDTEELIDKLTLHRAMLKGNAELLIVTDEEAKMDVAYAVTFPKSLYGYVLLKYFAVFPWVRGKGIGIESMRLLNKQYADRQGIVAEITDFPDDDPNHQKKLFRFFARFGYVLVDSDYRIGGTEAHVMVKPIKGGTELSPVVHRMVRDYYSRVLSITAMEKMIDCRPLRK